MRLLGSSLFHDYDAMTYDRLLTPTFINLLLTEFEVCTLSYGPRHTRVIKSERKERGDMWWFAL